MNPDPQESNRRSRLARAASAIEYAEVFSQVDKSPNDLIAELRTRSELAGRQELESTIAATSIRELTPELRSIIERRETQDLEGPAYVVELLSALDS
ncbi:MAG: hypothetical protein R2733_20160 [Acidimicrobiales bacterium]